MSLTPPDGAPEPQASGRLNDFQRGDYPIGMTTAPAGWYPTPSGGQQYWDGEQWLALPSPSAPPASGSPISDTVATPRKPLRKWLVIAGAALLFLGLVAGGIAWKVADDNRQAQAAAEAAAEAAAQKSAAEEREAQQREDAAAAAQKKRDDAERESRRASVTEIETSVEKMAKGHASDGAIDGPIIDVSCSPVGGGSTDDLTEQTTVFECFVANEDNGDGTMSGYTYNATMNWSSGSYTYGLGAP